MSVQLHATCKNSTCDGTNEAKNYIKFVQMEVVAGQRSIVATAQNSHYNNCNFIFLLLRKVFSAKCEFYIFAFPFRSSFDSWSPTLCRIWRQRTNLLSWLHLLFHWRTYIFTYILIPRLAPVRPSKEQKNTNFITNTFLFAFLNENFAEKVPSTARYGEANIISCIYTFFSAFVFCRNSISMSAHGNGMFKIEKNKNVTN